MKINDVYIELTSNCNLRCSFCYNHSGDMFKELDFNVIKKLIDYLCMQNVKEVFLSGGEPTLYSKIYELIEYLDSKEIDINLVTNGTLLTKINIQELKKIKNFQISLEGLNLSTNVLRGDGTYELINKNIAHIVLMILTLG